MALQKAVAAVVLYASVAFLALLLLIAMEEMPAWSLTFEIVSALSTTGLTVGATSGLSTAGKLIISLLMLIGRIGLITVAVAGLGSREDRKFRYPVGQFYIG